MRNFTAIIPARAGSKGIKNKNIHKLAGKPLIAYTIEAAKNSKYIKDIILSTDSDTIAGIGKSYGARVPFMRPRELASDTSRRNDVIFHAIEWLKSHSQIYCNFIYLQPTSPLRETCDIDGAVDYLFEKDAKAVLSVTKAKHNPALINTLPSDLKMNHFFQNIHEDFNRQEMPTYYRLNGAIYISTIDYFYENNGFIGAETFAYIMSELRSIDIDSPEDINYAEFIIKAFNKK